MTSPQLRQFVRSVLADVGGAPTPEPAQLASAFELLCEKLRGRLYPVFGAAAVDALFARAVHLATVEYAWLREMVSHGTHRCTLDRAHVSRAEPGAETLAEGLAAVLAHDIALLSAYIGDDFVLPLVQEAWGTDGTPAASSRIEEKE